LVDAAVDVAEVGGEHGQAGGQGVAAFDVLEAEFAFAAVAEFGQACRERGGERIRGARQGGRQVVLGRGGQVLRVSKRREDEP
jgi:hypothetical protein